MAPALDGVAVVGVALQLSAVDRECRVIRVMAVTSLNPRASATMTHGCRRGALTPGHEASWITTEGLPHPAAGDGRRVWNCNTDSIRLASGGEVEGPNLLLLVGGVLV